MEIKQEQDVQWCVDSMWVMEEYDPYKEVDVSTNSLSSLCEDEYFCYEDDKLKLEDYNLEHDPFIDADDSKVLHTDVSSDKLISRIKENETLKDVSLFRIKKENCSCTEWRHSDCHVVVHQKVTNDFYITQQPDLVKLDVFTEGVSEHRKPTSKNDHVSFLNNVKLGIDIFKETITEATKTVCDSEYQLVNTEIITNKFDNNVDVLADNSGQLLEHEFDDNVDVHPGNSSQLLEHEFDDNVDNPPGSSSQLLEHEFGVFEDPHVDLLSDARRKLSNEIHKLTVCGHYHKDRDQFKTDTMVQIAEKPYKCDFCNLHFRWNSSLKRHKRIHTGENPYKCDVCGLGFKQNCSLRKHRRLHTGEKPYKCDVCGLDFKDNGNLKNHKRRHTGEKPYKCDICGVAFTRNASLKRHKRMHSGEKLPMWVPGPHFGGKKE